SLYSDSYVAKEVEPKRTKVKESMEKLELMLQALAKKKFELHGVEDKNTQLRAKYDALITKNAKIEAEIEETRVKLIRVDKISTQQFKYRTNAQEDCINSPKPKEIPEVFIQYLGIDPVSILGQFAIETELAERLILKSYV
ncbi:MAG: hypothetical protein EZS28_015391, partial [Streblomastix strix]